MCPEVHHFLEKYPNQGMFEKDDDFLNTIDANEIIESHLVFYENNRIDLTLLSDYQIEQKLKELIRIH